MILIMFKYKYDNCLLISFLWFLNLIFERINESHFESDGLYEINNKGHFIRRFLSDFTIFPSGLPQVFWKLPAAEIIPSCEVGKALYFSNDFIVNYHQRHGKDFFLRGRVDLHSTTLRFLKMFLLLQN